MLFARQSNRWIAEVIISRRNMASFTRDGLSAAQAPQPNLYEVRGQGVSISYSTSSVDGTQQFNYRDQDRTVSRSGDEIRTEETEIAKLVTINVEDVQEAREVTATLVLPRIFLDEPTADTPVATIGVLATSRPADGQMRTYRALELTGTARLVAF